MRTYRYVFDPLFVAACALYALNRWAIKPHSSIEFFHSWCSDVLLIPCALPPVLLLHRWLRLRDHDRPPTALEIAGHWLGWSVLFEVICPRFMPHTTGDPWDVAAYAVGAIGAYWWWQRDLSPARVRSRVA